MVEERNENMVEQKEDWITWNTNGVKNLDNRDTFLHPSGRDEGVQVRLND